MKKFISLLVIALLTAVAFEASAQNGLYYQGKYVRFIHPREIAGSKDATFPTFLNTTVAYAADSIGYKVVEHSTYLRPDTIRSNTTLHLTVSEYVKGGALLFIHPAGADTAPRTLTIKQNNIPIDTISVTGTKVKRSYIYTGTRFEKY